MPLNQSIKRGGLVKITICAIVGFLFFGLMGTYALGGDPAYLIGAGDIVEISVWKDESLSKQLVVPPDRVISFPLIGDIEVSSLTVADLRKEVTKRLKEYVPDVTVTVMLSEINSLRAYVIGKVNRPGEFPIKMDTSVLQVLSMAGGLTPFASSGNIIIIRRENQAAIKIPFDYNQVAEGKSMEQNILLQRGDVVLVP
jgi:polysaccharide export outer membrane protein